MTLTRRHLLRNSLALGCSLAASPLVTPITLASTPGEARLVVIVLRGGMDGLDVIRPVGDRNFAAFRPSLLPGGLALDPFYELHPSLAALHPLWAAGELSFAHAVSTPYRDRRSHFDGQDFLENGGYDPDGALTTARDGWLNRALSGLNGTHSQTGFAVGHETLLLLQGDTPVSTWGPEASLELSPQAQALLTKIYAGDPLFADAAAQAADLAGLSQDGGMNVRQARRAEALASFTAERLREDTRIAAFSLGGWDTHARQSHSLPRALGELSTAITTLHEGLGPEWRNTVVMAVTEFGRTVRENGSGGTDHGTGGAALFAGGALAGGRAFAEWPGLSEAALYENRDLMPTRDLRALMGWVLRDHLALPQSFVEQAVFPGVALDTNPRLIA